MDEASIQKAALFFVLTTLDEAWSLEGLREVTHRYAQLHQPGSADMVRLLGKEWQRLRKKMMKDPQHIRSSKQFHLPKGFNLGRWLDFRKKCDANVFMTVTLCLAVQLSEQVVADGLGVSVGTVRYRLFEGLRLLGQLMQPTPQLVSQ